MRERSKKSKTKNDCFNSRLIKNEQGVAIDANIGPPFGRAEYGIFQVGKGGRPKWVGLNGLQRH